MDIFHAHASFTTSNKASVFLNSWLKRCLFTQIKHQIIYTKILNCRYVYFLKAGQRTYIIVRYMYIIYDIIQRVGICFKVCFTDYFIILQTFNFNVKSIHWPTYMESYCLGIKRFVLREELSELSKARQTLKRLVYFSVNMHY